MRYVYELFEDIGSTHTRRVNITTKFEEVEKLVSLLSHPWRVDVYDQMKPRDDSRILVINDQCGIEQWSETIGRSVWLDADTKERIKQEVALHSAMGWKPFDEAETGIHMKHEEPDKAPAVIVPDALEQVTDSNIKTRAAIGKPKMSGVPPVAFFALGSAMQDGVRKYGRFNWRGTEVTASVFYDAMERHILAWYSGEECASDSGVHHLAHVMACCAIILDAQMHDVFTDDRHQSAIVPEKKHWMKPDANTG